MLAEVLTTQYTPQLATLAEAWLNAGASAFSIWLGGRIWTHWPGHTEPPPASLRADLQSGDTIVGELQVAGMEGHEAAARLVADAALVSQLIGLEDDLRTMTGELLESQDQLIALSKLTRSMRSRVTVPETLQCLVMEAMRLLKAQGGFALLLPPSGRPVVTHCGGPRLDDGQIWEWFWQAHSTARELLLTSSSDAEHLPEGIQNLAMAPINVRDAVVAGLGLFNRRGEGFAAPHVKLLRAIAEQGGAQIENVILYQEKLEQARLQTEMELARRVQLRLLPQRLPSVSGLDIYAHSRPAHQVGGDFYDFVTQPERPLIFAIGDVTGKGLSAALLMTMTRTAIHSKASFMPEPTPEIIMSHSNEDLYDDFTQVGMFATVFVGQYQPQRQRLVYANAGHSPVIYCPAEGSARLVEADGTAMGVLTVSLARNQSLPMRPGDVLVVLTDGFNEARNPADELFGYTRLLELVERLATQPAAQIADGLFAAVDQFSGGRAQDDDQTLVVIKGVTMP